MAASAYKVADVAVTGTEASPQTINYGDLTDIDGNAVPATFAAAPAIWRSPQQDRNCYIVEKTTTYFKVALSMAGVDGACTFDFMIVGEEV